jgi:PAS domain S-box-containing protein
VLSSAAQGRFAAEFATFLVATAGLSVVGLRPELLSRTWWARTLLVLGFTAVGTAAFLQGSLIVADRQSAGTAIAAGLGLVAIAAGTSRWEGSAPARRLLWGGAVLQLASIALTQAGGTTSTDVVLGAGAVFIGLALLTASRRSVAARVAASAAGTLLVFALVLSVALSAEAGRNVEDNVKTRIDAQAAAETNLILNAGQTNCLVIARSASLVLSSSAQAATELQRLAATNSTTPSATLNTLLGILRGRLLGDVSLLYVDHAGHILGLGLSQTANVDQATLVGITQSVPVQQVIGRGSIAPDSERGSVEVVGRQAVAIGVEPVALLDPTTRLVDYPGVLVAVQPLNDAYLSVRSGLGKIGLALVSRGAVLGQAGDRVAPTALVPLASAALDSGGPIVPRLVGDHFFSARPVVTTDNRQVMALVASTPTAQVINDRNRLFQILFEIALGGTLIALLLASIVGDRIGAGLRTLTEAAQRIQRGEFAEPAGVRTDDEVGVLGAAFDSMASSISDQTAALQQAATDEAALRNQLEAVVAGMGEALVAVDASGTVTLVNRAAEELLDVEAATAVGQPVEDVIIAAAADGSDVLGRLKRATPSPWSALATLIPDQGPAIPVAITAGALRSPDGGVAGAVLVLRDLRPERQVERMKSEFLSRIGHELRTPLTAILGYADILVRRKVAPARAGQFHQEILEAGKRLSRIVEMLEFSAAAEAGRSLMRPERTSVRSIVDGVVAEWQERLNGNHAVARRVARGLPEIVADRRWLTLSLNELIDNAVKFSPDGGRIAVTAAPTTMDDRPAVEIAVVDQGVGLSDAEQDRMFAEFIQADSSDTRRFSGLGLGLSMVKRVAEAHGGTVTCASTPHKGSKFSIVLPA